MNARAKDILDFWFGTDPTAVDVARWFVRDDALDDDIRRLFGADVEAAVAGERAAWEQSDDARERLAALVLLDQFPRNIHRGSPLAFAGDVRALAVSRKLRASGLDRSLRPLERYVALLPTMHAEDVAAQREGVTDYGALLEEATSAGAPASVLGALRSACDYARQHAAIVERFGRFPHRNAVLGRASTEDEIAFLETPGSRF